VPSDSTNNVSSKILSNGFYYKCTTAGTSGTSLPTWLATTGATVSDNTITWTAMREGGVEVWQASHAYSVGTIVIPTLNNGHYYKCTAVAGTGTSGANEPSSANTPSNAWTTTTNGTVTDGTAPNQITWREAGTILDNNEANIQNLYTYLTTQQTRYGTGYTVTEKIFIRFIPGASSSDPNQEDSAVAEKDILKVTIKNNDSAETLTQLFTIR